MSFLVSEMSFTVSEMSFPILAEMSFGQNAQKKPVSVQRKALGYHRFKKTAMVQRFLLSSLDLAKSRIDNMCSTPSKLHFPPTQNLDVMILHTQTEKILYLCLSAIVFIFDTLPTTTPSVVNSV